MSLFKKNATSILTKSSSSNSGAQWVTDEVCTTNGTNFLDAMTETVGRSFAGSVDLGTPQEPVMSWTFRGLIPPNDVMGFQFLMAFYLEQRLRRGAVLFGHSSTSKSSRQSPSRQTCCLLEEVDPSPAVKRKRAKKSHWESVRDGLMGAKIYLKIRRQGNLPQFLQDSGKIDAIETRGKLHDARIKKMRQLYGPSEKHIHVAVVATDPEHQGQGLGSELMHQVNAIGDAEGKTLYVECATDKNRKFYEKFGYRVIHTETLKDEVDSDDERLVLFLMTREPSSPTLSQ